LTTSNGRRTFGIIDKTKYEIYIPAEISASGMDEVEATFTHGKYAREWLVEEYGTNWKKTTFYKVRRRATASTTPTGELIAGSRCPECKGELVTRRGRYWCSKCTWKLPEEAKREAHEIDAFRIAYVLLMRQRGKESEIDPKVLGLTMKETA
jgi:uncharacterized paraquat-inducible protein A